MGAGAGLTGLEALAARGIKSIWGGRAGSSGETCAPGSDSVLKRCHRPEASSPASSQILTWLLGAAEHGEDPGVQHVPHGLREGRTPNPR